MTQVWKLGNTLFSDFGVYVQSTSGVLNFPSLTDEGHDWLDENGKNYWLDPGDLKKSDRDIILNCWITASSYTEFKANVAAFFAAITGEGLQTLVTPFCDIENVALHDSVPVTRKSTYVMSKSAGVFTLRMKAMGDGMYSILMAVYRPSSPEYPSGSLAGYISAGSDMKVVKRMHGEAYVTCSVEQNSMAAFYRNDYILVYCSSFTIPEKYYLDKDPEVRKLSSNKYVINYRFEQETYRLRNMAFLSLNNEGDFYWFANLDEILDRLFLNTARYSAGLFVKDSNIPATVRKNHKFSAQSCWDVLVSMCELYQLEFVWRYDGTSVWTLYVDERISRQWPFQMEYGKGEGFYDIQRDALDREELCTVLYAFGANKNIKFDYGSERLVCPGNPLEQNTEIYGRVEKIQYFEDVFPALSASADAYDQVLAVTGDPVYEAIKEVWPTGMFRITANIGFNLWEKDADGFWVYHLGIPPKVAMRSGDLAGMEFEVNKYDPVDSDVPTGPGYFYLDPIVDEHAGTFPSEDFYIAAGDSFTLLDINQPESYVTDAEISLLGTAQTWLADHSTPKVTYRATLDPAITKSMMDSGIFATGLDIGDSIEVVDANLDMNGYFRVSELTMDYEIKKYDLTLSELRPLTPREILKQRVSNIEKTVGSTKSNTETGTQKSNETTAEVLNRVFDRRDGRIKPDNIRTESADPRTLAYDAGVPQFQVIGMIVETSYQGDDNKVKVSAGSIEVLNWAPLTRTRYDIDKMITEGKTYDPRRTWTFPETIITLPDDDPYYLLAKLPRDETVTVGTLVATDNYIRVKADADYLQYNLGMLNAPGSPRVASMLWGNVKPSPADITNAIDPRLLGGGRCLYLHNNEGDLTGYGQALYTDPDDPYTLYSVTGADGEVLIHQFVSATGMGVIPAGAWVFTTYGAVTTDDDVILGVEVLRMDATGGELPIMNFTQDLDGVVVAPVYHAEPLDQLVLDDSERLVLRYTADFGSMTTRTAYMGVEGDEAGYYWWSNVRIPGDGLDVSASGGLSTVYTRYSVTGDGSSGEPVELVGDVAAPGGSMYYGTDAGGSRGWHDLPDAASGDDNYVDGATFSGTTRDLTLTRTGDLEDITVNIPCCDPTEVIQGAVTNIKYGALYNWWAATDVRNIAPAGWHVPTITELTTLITTLGGENVAGGKSKEIGTDYWNSPNSGASNSSGFNGRGHGQRTFTAGTYGAVKYYGQFWASNEGSTNTNGRITRLNYDTAYFDYSYSLSLNKKCGIAIRLLKDNSTDTGTMVGNDGKVYPTVTIGTQVWMAANLAETKYRNGDLISNHGETYADKYTNEEWAALTTEAMCWYDDNPDNGYTDVAVIQHNLLGGLQGGSTLERYHHTKAEADTHVFEAPIDENSYVRKDGAWEIMPESSGGSIIEKISFEYKDIETGVSQTYWLDDIAKYGYTILGAILCSDTTMDAVEIQINGTPVIFGSNSYIDVTTSSADTEATDDNVVVEDDVVTLVTSGTDGGAEYLRGSIYYQRT